MEWPEPKSMQGISVFDFKYDKDILTLAHISKESKRDSGILHFLKPENISGKVNKQGEHFAGKILIAGEENKFTYSPKTGLEIELKGNKTIQLKNSQIPANLQKFISKKAELQEKVEQEIDRFSSELEELESKSEKSESAKLQNQINSTRIKLFNSVKKQELLVDKEWSKHNAIKYINKSPEKLSSNDKMLLSAKPATKAILDKVDETDAQILNLAEYHVDSFHRELLLKNNGELLEELKSRGFTSLAEEMDGAKLVKTKEQGEITLQELMDKWYENKDEAKLSGELKEIVINSNPYSDPQHRIELLELAKAKGIKIRLIDHKSRVEEAFDEMQNNMEQVLVDIDDINHTPKQEYLENKEELDKELAELEKQEAELEKQIESFNNGENITRDKIMFQNIKKLLDKGEKVITIIGAGHMIEGKQIIQDIAQFNKGFDKEDYKIIQEKSPLNKRLCEYCGQDKVLTALVDKKVNKVYHDPEKTFEAFPLASKLMNTEIKITNITNTLSHNFKKPKVFSYDLSDPKVKTYINENFKESDDTNYKEGSEIKSSYYNTDGEALWDLVLVKH